MDKVVIALVSGGIGTILGSVIGFAGQYLLNRQSHRQELELRKLDFRNRRRERRLDRLLAAAEKLEVVQWEYLSAVAQWRSSRQKGLNPESLEHLREVRERADELKLNMIVIGTDPDVPADLKTQARELHNEFSRALRSENPDIIEGLKEATAASGTFIRELRKYLKAQEEAE